MVERWDNKMVGMRMKLMKGWKGTKRTASQTLYRICCPWKGEDFKASALIAFGVGNIERDKSLTGGFSTATSSKSNSQVSFSQ